MVPAGISKSFSIILWFFCKATINLDIAVAATSGDAICELNALPNAKSWSVVIPAVLATPVHLFANSVISLLVAVLDVASLNIALPVDKRDFSIPIFGIRPITSTILESAGRASSPISSPIATFIWSAARTKPDIPSVPYFDMPSLAPSYAIFASPSVEVLVSILARDLESSFISSLAKPAILRISVKEPEYSKFFLMTPVSKDFI